MITSRAGSSLGSFQYNRLGWFDGAAEAVEVTATLAALQYEAWNGGAWIYLDSAGLQSLQSLNSGNWYDLIEDVVYPTGFIYPAGVDAVVHGAEIDATIAAYASSPARSLLTLDAYARTGLAGVNYEIPRALFSGETLPAVSVTLTVSDVSLPDGATGALKVYRAVGFVDGLLTGAVLLGEYPLAVGTVDIEADITDSISAARGACIYAVAEWSVGWPEMYTIYTQQVVGDGTYTDMRYGVTFSMVVPA